MTYHESYQRWRSLLIVRMREYWSLGRVDRYFS